MDVSEHVHMTLASRSNLFALASHCMDVEGNTMNEALPLKEAVAKSAAGDQNAFRAVFDLVGDKLFRYLLGQLGDRDEALDCLQDTLVDLWKGLPRFRYRSDAEFWGYVFLIARRKVFARRKQAQTKHVAVDNATLEVLHDASPEAPAIGDTETLVVAMQRLTDASREVLSLRYWSDLSFKEIALATNVTENAAKVRHHRALKELQDYLPNTYVEQQFT